MKKKKMGEMCSECEKEISSEEFLAIDWRKAYSEIGRNFPYKEEGYFCSWKCLVAYASKQKKEKN